MSNSKTINPHAKPDGTPKLGELAQFVKWEEKQAQKRYDALSSSEKKQVDEAMSHFAQKQSV